MRRFLTLVLMLGLAIPAGVSISGCYRNPAGKYCPVTSGYGTLVGQVTAITLQPQVAGISLAYGQTTQPQPPSAVDCLGDAVSVSSKQITWGTTNNQLVDISPAGAICAGTWNRNTGGGIADYTYCNLPSPLPQTNGLPYSVAYITASADSVTSNPVAVYIHPQVSSISLVGPQSCESQSQVAQLDAQACFAQNGKQYLLCAPASVTTASNPSLACPLPSVNGTQVPLSSIPACNSSIGTMSFNVGNSSVASINSTSNQITAQQPGTTVITASLASSGSSAGYFSTCPPASISVTLANGSTSGTITQGVPQNLTTTVYDTNVTECPPLGCPITGLNLTYQSTNPIDIEASAGGSITTSFPGVASVTALCQPNICNPAPSNQIGFNGTGLALASNPVTITTPGTASNYLWLAAPGVSRYFVPVELLTGTLGSNVLLPYVPNSMMMDRGGNTLYFGSARELMTYSTSSNAISGQTGIPGVVLAVAPDNSHVLVNDQAQHVFYIYSSGGGSSVSFPGMGNAAQWTPDAQTLYITDNANLNTPASCYSGSTPPPTAITGHTDTLYVYNVNTGWSTYSLPPSPLPPDAIPSCTAQPNTAAALPLFQQTPAVLIPSVGAYMRGIPTQANTWCPSGTVGNQATITYYPVGDSENVQSDVLASTLEGHHVLSAEWNTGGSITLNDIAITIPPGLTINGIPTPAACPVSTTTNPTTGVQTQTMTPLNISSTSTQTAVSVNATLVNQVVTGATPTPVSGGTGQSLAFITYSGTSANASLPYYLPASSGAGSVNYVTLTECPQTLSNGQPNPAYPGCLITAPLAGAFSPDNTLFFVSTTGDNMIHYISIPSSINSSSVPTDTQQISPKLTGCDPSADTGCVYTGTPGAFVPATAIAVKPRSTT